MRDYQSRILITQLVKKTIAAIPPRIYDRPRPGMQLDILLVRAKMEKNLPPSPQTFLGGEGARKMSNILKQ